MKSDFRKYFYPLGIVAIYLFFGILWISFSDQILLMLVDDPVELTRLQTHKGWLFVVLTTALLCVLLYRYSSRLIAVVEEKSKVEEQLGLAMRSADMGLFDADLQSRTTFYSPVWKRQLGYSEDEIGDSYEEWKSRVHPDDLPNAMNLMEKCLASSAVNFRAEFRMRHKDGTYRWILGTAFLKTDEQGKPVRVVGLNQDINDLKQAQAELEKQQLNYRNLFNSIRDVIIIADLDRVIIDANQPALRDVFGYETGEVLGRKTEMLYADFEEFQSMGKVFFNSAATSALPVMETSFRRKNGSVFLAELFPLKLTDSDGHQVANIGMIRDVSQRKNVEKLLSHVFESMGEGMAVVDRDFNILVANRAYSELFGESAADVIGKHCYAVSHRLSGPCHQHGFDCPVHDAFRTGQAHAVVHKHQDEQGNTRYHENRAYPLRNEEGIVTSAIEVFNDITERQLLDLQLRQAQKMEAIGTLTGGIAHDFNNILSVIVGHGTLMQLKTAATSPLRNSIDSILQAAERAASLTQRLLTFSRKQIMEFEPVILCEVVGSLQSLLEKMTRENIDLDILLRDEPMIIEADRGQIEQMLMNLVINAAQAIKGQGKVEIRIEKGEIDTNFVHSRGFGVPGAYAVLTVRDNGSGMDEETQAKIYEPFFTTKEVGAGTGLGLSVVYGIVKQHGAYIDCVSTPGAGTTFSVYFPLSERLPRRNMATSRPLAVASGPATILVAEDDENVRLLLKELIEQAGYEVITAANGLEAISKFTENRHRIDLLIFDVIMPQLNGKEALIEIRKMQPEVRAVFISGYTDDILHSEGMEVKSVPLLHKPIAPKVLLEKIQSVLERQAD